MLSRITLISLFLSVHLWATAQRKELVLDYWLSALASEEEESDELYRLLESLHSNPLNLNSADTRTLNDCILLNSQQVQEIQAYIREYGHFISLYELQRLPSFEQTSLKFYFPFLSIGNIQSYTTRFTEYTASYESKWPLSRGYTNNYVGTPGKYRLRIRQQERNYKFDLRYEKDEGESFFNSRSRPEYLSGTLSLLRPGFFSKIIIGDIAAELGQGLTLSTRPTYSYNGITSHKKKGQALQAYNSYQEEGRFFGLALNSAHISLFAGLGRNDASTNDLGQVKSISTTGFHRTISEIRNKDKIKDILCGFDYKWQLNNGQIGLTGMARAFDRPVSAKQEPYAKFYFSGRFYSKNSIYYDLSAKAINFFGELAWDHQNSKLANIHGLIVNIHNTLDLAITARNYPASYNGLHSQPLSRSLQYASERGVQTLLLCRLGKHEITSSTELYGYSWLRYQVPHPTQYQRWQIDWRFAAFGSKYHIRSYYRDYAERHSTWAALLPKRGLRVHCETEINSALRMRSRLEWVYAAKQTGTLAFQDLRYSWNNGKISASVRLSTCGYSSPETTPYAFESVPQGAASLRAYRQSGFYYYFMVKFKPNPHWTIWIKLNRDRYTFQQSTYGETPSYGTGNEYRNGNRKTTFALQIKYRS